MAVEGKRRSVVTTRLSKAMEAARMPEEGYRGPQVCKIVGITYRQLDYWARTDLIRPSLALKGLGLNLK